MQNTFQRDTMTTHPRLYFMQSLIGIIIVVQLTRLAQVMECFLPMTQQPVQTSN